MSNQSKFIKGVTKSGFRYSFPKDRLWKYELLELLADMNEDMLSLPRVVKMLLGEKQTIRLKDHIRDKYGIVPMSRIEEEIREIFENQGELKNS